MVARTCSLRVTCSKNNSLELTLPFRLTPAVEISSNDGTTVTDYPVDPDTNYVVAGATYKLDFDPTAISDTACLDETLTSLSTPLLEVELHVGEGIRGDTIDGEEAVSETTVGPLESDWTKVNDEHWEQRP